MNALPNCIIDIIIINAAERVNKKIETDNPRNLKLLSRIRCVNKKLYNCVEKYWVYHAWKLYINDPRRIHKAIINFSFMPNKIKDAVFLNACKTFNITALCYFKKHFAAEMIGLKHFLTTILFDCNYAHNFLIDLTGINNYHIYKDYKKAIIEIGNTYMEKPFAYYFDKLIYFVDDRYQFIIQITNQFIREKIRVNSGGIGFFKLCSDYFGFGIQDYLIHPAEITVSTLKYVAANGCVGMIDYLMHNLDDYISLSDKAQIFYLYCKRNFLYGRYSFIADNLLYYQIRHGIKLCIIFNSIESFTYLINNNQITIQDMDDWHYFINICLLHTTNSAFMKIILKCADNIKLNTSIIRDNLPLYKEIMIYFVNNKKINELKKMSNYMFINDCPKTLKYMISRYNNYINFDCNKKFIAACKNKSINVAKCLYNYVTPDKDFFKSMIKYLNYDELKKIINYE